MPAGGWNDETEKQLLIATIYIMGGTLGKARFGEVAALMGNGTSGESAYRQFIKLRKAAEAAWGPPADAEAGSTPQKSPLKRGGKKAAGGGAGKVEGKRKAKEVLYDDEGEDEEESPSKRVKAAVKEEKEDDDGLFEGEASK